MRSRRAATRTILIAALAAENKARHDRFGAAIYVLEPNLKQGIGALRDLQTALWAAAVRWHPPRPGSDPASGDTLIDNLVSRGHLTRRQGDVLANARDFQLRLRALVQLAAGRRFDQLTFEIQEAIAPTWYPDAHPHEGDVRPAVAPAVEALMRDYYLHARAVTQVAERLLESARVPARRRPRIATIDGTFITFNGELALKDPRRFTERPAEMVRLFRVAVVEKLAGLRPHARAGRRDDRARSGAARRRSVRGAAVARRARRPARSRPAVGVRAHAPGRDPARC